MAMTLTVTVVSQEYIYVMVYQILYLICAVDYMSVILKLFFKEY
jgi:hypothetical protein